MFGILSVTYCFIFIKSLIIYIRICFSISTVEFLDVNISLGEGFFSRDLYIKPTDKHMYLIKKSRHPEYTKKYKPF